MAIANDEPEPTIPSVILAVIHAPPEELPGLEKQMRSKELAILQKRSIEMSEEEQQSWFTEGLTVEGSEEDTCYVLQGMDAAQLWEELSQEIGKNICGTGNEDDLKRLFENVVVDEYLLKPDWATQHLADLKPMIMAGLTAMCKDMPEDPVVYLAEYLEKNGSQA